MRNNKLIYLLLSFTGMCFSACDKEGDKVFFTGSTAPQLSVSSTSDLTLLKANENFSSLQFQWTNPNYTYSNGVNTQDVNYILEIDTTGSNFSNPKRASIGFTKEVAKSFSVKELNNLLSSVELKDYVLHPFEFRIKATLYGGSVPVYSNVVKVNIATYLDVVYPVPANLYIIGDATPQGWDNVANYPAAQTFTKVNSYLFQINSLAITDKHFLFLPVAGDWSHKYAFGTSDGEKDKNSTTGDKFTYDGKNDFQAPAAGNYKITVNFKTGKYSMEKL
jgi:hypothetical protein